MTEHTIRLRGGWTCRAAGSHDSAERVLILPVRWGPDDARRMTLTRRFGRPRLDVDRETLVLRMDHVGGILSIRLNGHPIEPVSAQSSGYEIELADLPERNTLVLEIENPDARLEAVGVVPEWGMISLVVVHRAEPANEP